MAPTVGILGSGGAGLITAHTLLKDGFDVQILTRDHSPGGVWAKHRAYDGILLNNVYGEWRFSCLDMPPPANAQVTGGRLGGEDMTMYMENFAERFLKGRFRFGVEILNVVRKSGSYRGGWVVTLRDQATGTEEMVYFDKIVVCTGGCSEPFIPEQLVPRANQFAGPICHSSEFKVRSPEMLAASAGKDKPGRVVIVGGGRSAQDLAAQLTNKGRNVSMVYELTDAFLANPTPLPAFVRKSRLLSLFSPHIELRSRLERFLHTTCIGGAIVRGLWSVLQFVSFKTFNVTPSSPLRNAHSLFWSLRVNDEGVGSPHGFHAVVNAGRIDIVTPARVESFGEDGKSIVLNNGTILQADAIVLCTGFTSSWKKIFDVPTMEDIGLARHPPSTAGIQAAKHLWDYTSLKNPPRAHAQGDQWCSSIYRGIVPAKSILRRDFAINGAIFSTNNGYLWEVVAHWISSYFLKDTFLRLPPSIEETYDHTEKNAAWLRKRFPDSLLWINESYSSNFVFFTWPQVCDELLDDMGLRSQRSGGSWITWPFKIINVNEIEDLGEERKAKRLV